jgi:hypothetical protein
VLRISSESKTHQEWVEKDGRKHVAAQHNGWGGDAGNSGDGILGVWPKGKRDDGGHNDSEENVHDFEPLSRIV